MDEHVADIKTGYQKARTAGDADKEKWYAEALGPWLQKLEAVLGASPGFAVGGARSLADVAIFHLVSECAPRASQSAPAAAAPAQRPV